MNSDFSVATHALVFLSCKNTVLSSEELADSICTNPARVRKVVSKLKKAGLVDTKEGSVGGCHFGGDPAAINLAQVADALNVTFVEATWHSGDQNRDCLICSGMAGLMDELFSDLDSRCKARLREITIADLAHRLLSDASPI